MTLGTVENDGGGGGGGGGGGEGGGGGGGGSAGATYPSSGAEPFCTINGQL